MKAIDEKNPSLAKKDVVAKQVGVGAVIFHDLYNQRIKNVNFSWDEVLSFEGSTGPYVQYTYARAGSILRKSGDAEVVSAVDCGALTDDVTFALIKVLLDYENAIIGAVERYEPSVLARYLITLTTAFNRFYHECPILQAEEKEKKARLFIVDLVQRVIKDACSLLGLECPEEM